MEKEIKPYTELIEKKLKLYKMNDLKNKIGNKVDQIRKLNWEINILKEKMINESISEIPILMFLIDVSMPIDEHQKENGYEYIYYYPDYDKVDIITSHLSDNFLPNYIDARELFKDTKIPDKLMPGDSYKYLDKFCYFGQILNEVINNMFEKNAISSWEELRVNLVSFLDQNKNSKNDDANKLVLK